MKTKTQEVKCSRSDIAITIAVLLVLVAGGVGFAWMAEWGPFGETTSELIARMDQEAADECCGGDLEAMKVYRSEQWAEIRAMAKADSERKREETGKALGVLLDNARAKRGGN